MVWIDNNYYVESTGTQADLGHRTMFQSSMFCAPYGTSLGKMKDRQLNVIG